MIQKRKYGRKAGSSEAFVEAPYVIKIGYNQGGETGGKKPGKLPGFLICHNSKAVGDRNFAPALDEMASLGFSEKDIEQAKKDGLRAPAGQFLPLGLRVVIPRDARRIGTGETARWAFPGTYVEEYQLWGKNGYQCHGDGITAYRRQADHTFKQMECKPVGADGRKDSDCCPFSVKGECRSKSRWIFTLFFEKDGREYPLSKSLGWSATFKLDTTSEYAAMNILDELNAAAERLNGRISGLTGVLFFGVQEKRHSGGASVGKVGQIRLHLDEDVLDRRESGESERILAGVSETSEPSSHRREFAERILGRELEVSQDLPQQPEREERQERERVQEPADHPAPDKPETSEAADFEGPKPPGPGDVKAMDEAELVAVCREYVEWKSAVSDTPQEDIERDIIFFNAAGKTVAPTLSSHGWDYFTQENERHADRIGVLRDQIAPRVVIQADFEAFWAEREGVRS